MADILNWMTDSTEMNNWLHTRLFQLRNSHVTIITLQRVTIFKLNLFLKYLRAIIKRWNRSLNYHKMQYFEHSCLSLKFYSINYDWYNKTIEVSLGTYHL